MPSARLFLLLAAFAAAPLAAQTTHTVIVRNFEFDPASLEIEAGDTVVWSNEEGFHNVNGTTDTFPGNPDGFGNTPAGAPWTYEFTFDTAGDYDYQCDVHPAQMQGSVTVNTASSAEDDLPAGTTLVGPSPNPFQRATNLALTMATPEPVRVAVYDVRGREITVLHEGLLPAGQPVSLTWAPPAARSGVYVVRIQGETFRAVRKLVLVR